MLLWCFRLHNHENKYSSLYTLNSKMRSGRTLRRTKKNNLEDETFLIQIQEEIEAENDHDSNDMNASDNFDQMREEIGSKN